jgi:hypothetical protein
MRGYKDYEHKHEALRSFKLFYEKVNETKRGFMARGTLVSRIRTRLHHRKPARANRNRK